MPADFADRTDFDNASRGLIARLASGSLQGIDAAVDAGVLKTLLSLTDEPDPSFAVVTP